MEEDLAEESAEESEEGPAEGSAEASVDEKAKHSTAILLETRKVRELFARLSFHVFTEKK